MKYIRKSALSFLLVFSLIVGIVGVVSIDTTYAASKKIHLKKTTVSIVVGKTYQQKLIDKNGKTIKATKVKWKSSKTSIAKISKKGKIKTLKAGTVKMTAKYKGKTYKFSVRVVAPFEEDEKPTIYEVVQNGDDNNIWINPSWSSLKNAKSYELYVSVNGGEYTLVEDEPSCYGLYKPAIAGNTYTFKVRGVYGKYYSEFSEEQSITVKPYHNTSIKLEPSSISLEIGETKTVNVITDGGYGMTSRRSNSNISSSWGDWISGTNTCTLSITGLKAGTSTIEVFDKKDNSVSGSLTVEVKSPISASESSIVLQSPKEVKTITIYSNKQRELGYQASGTVLDTFSQIQNVINKCTFGEWDEQTHSIKMFIHGNYPGEGTIRIYDKNDSSVETTINVRIEHGVTVIPPNLPDTLKNLNKDGSVYSAVTVNRIEIEYSYSLAFDVAVKPTAYGVMSESGNPSEGRRCIIDYELYDADGKKVGTGTLNSWDSGSVPGESVKMWDAYGVKDLKPGVYTMKLIDYIG